MDVSENRGTAKSSILIRFSIINSPFWGTPIFGNPHIFRVFVRIDFLIGSIDPKGLMFRYVRYQIWNDVLSFKIAGRKVDFRRPHVENCALPSLKEWGTHWLPSKIWNKLQVDQPISAYRMMKALENWTCEINMINWTVFCNSNIWGCSGTCIAWLSLLFSSLNYLPQKSKDPGRSFAWCAFAVNMPLSKCVQFNVGPHSRVVPS